MDRRNLDDGGQSVPLHKSMRIVITQNRNKEAGVFNGRRVVIHRIEKATVFLKLGNDKSVNVYPVTTILENGKRRTCYPFVPSYAVTICKAQGQTLNSVIVWFDVPRIPAGSAYVALSRVKKSADLLLMTALQTSQFTPVVGIH